MLYGSFRGAEVFALRVEGGTMALSVMDSPVSPRSPRLVGAWWALGAVVMLLLPWWRNHTLLRDFYDYGNVIAAAGRIHLGERPYVDFLTPIQTLQFYSAALAESLFGERYLSLTYANAIFIAGAFWLLSKVLLRPLGWVTASLVAAAVTSASAAQHTLVWYNAMGVLWLAIAMWLAGSWAKEARSPHAEIVLLFAVLWLSGMTKLTYHAAAMAFVLLFIFRARLDGRITTKAAAFVVTGTLICGIAAPLATELLGTGATFAEWKHNVLLLAQSRFELLRAALGTKFYLRTPHDYYHPMYLPFVGAWGVAVLAGAVAIAGMSVWGRKEGRAREGLTLGVAALGALACGLVFLAAHFEIAYFAGAAWLVLATGLVVAFVPLDTSSVSRAARVLLGVAALTLLVPSWISAWQGARAIWGRTALNRAELVSTNDLPAEFRYLRGMRITPEMHGTLEEFSRYRRELESLKVPPSAFYFTNGTEWLVRVVPEARHGGLPLWLQPGTTFSPADLPAIAARFRRGAELQAIVAEDAWNTWPPELKSALDARYREQRAGVFRVYRLGEQYAEPLADPVFAAEKTETHLFTKRIGVREGRIDLFDAPEAWFIGSRASNQLELDFALEKLTGEMVLEREAGAGRETSAVFRIRERVKDRPGPVVLERRLSLSAGERLGAERFAVEAKHQGLFLEVELSPATRAIAGWRRLRANTWGGADNSLPGPLDAKLAVRPNLPSWSSALFASGSPEAAEIAGFGMAVDPTQRDGVPELFAHAPSEVWLRVERPSGRISGEFGLREGAWKNPDTLPGVRATVVFCHGGRLEVLFERELWTKRNEADRRPQTFDVALPEPTGWVGLIFRSLDPDTNAWGHSWWRKVRLEPLDAK